MKKLLLVVMMLALFIVPTCVFADAAAPVYIYYDAYVSNPNGASYYDFDNKVKGTLPFQTKITCYSYDPMGEKVEFIKEGGKNKEYYAIKYSDITIEDLSKYLLGAPEDAIAVDEAVIYSRPMINNQDKVDEFGTIPNGTEIKVQKYHDIELSEEWYNSEWVYVSYDGMNGWINHYALENGSYFIARELKYDLNGESKTIPMYTKIDNVYGGAGEAYFIYDGALIHCSFDYLAREITELERQNANYEIEVLFDGISLYEQASLTSTVLVESIPVGTKFYREASSYPMTCVTYEGTKGWICYVGLPYDMKTENRSIETIKQDYLKSLEWEKQDELNRNQEPVVAESLESATEPVEEYSNPILEDIVAPTIEPVTNQPMPPVVIVIIALLGAGLCASLAIILIILVNRKK